MKNSKLQKAIKVICFLLSCIFVLVASVSIRAIFQMYSMDKSGFPDSLVPEKKFNIMTSNSFKDEYINNLDIIIYSALYYDDLSLENFKKLENENIEQYCCEEVRNLKNVAESQTSLGKYVKEIFRCNGYIDYSGDTVVYRNEHNGAVIERTDPSNGLYLRDGKVYEYSINSELIKNDYIESQYKLFKENALNYQKNIGKIKNLKYAVVNKTDKKILTNMSGINQKSTSEQIQKVFSSFSWNVFYDSYSNYSFSEEIENYINSNKNAGLYQKDFFEADRYLGETPILLVTSIDSINYIHNITDEYEVYVGFDKTLAEKDNYSSIESNYLLTRDKLVKNTGMFSISVLCAFACIAYLVIKAGRKGNKDEVVLSKIDKIPNFMHFAINFGLILLLWIFSEEYNGVLSNIETSYIGFPTTCVVSYLLFIEWLLSFVRHIKNHSLLKHTLIGFIVSKIKNIKKEEILPDGKKIFIVTLISTVIYFLVLVVASILIINDDVAWIMFLWPLFLIVGAFIVISVFYVAKIMKATNKAKEGNYDYELNVSKFPIWLRKLAKDVTTMQSGTKTAIENAIKDQRMKTELITNVSHDLKTPLTAIINYIDLLGKCEIDNNTANEYINVLEDKSMRLKKLIEDLTEAAKASSGNIQVNKVAMNLNEIALQVSGEMSSELEKKNLELVLRLPTEAVKVRADSRLTFRIMENLMSNVSKYSMPNTRVYLSVSEEGWISVNNISENPIEVFAEELKNRFVRGDKSRTTEGSGLGLSIADDLCTIQGGKMELYIDGDMFKVTVKFEKII